MKNLQDIKHDKLYAQLTRKYSVALIFLAGIISASFVTFFLYFKTMKQDGYFINLSGRQRMLSHKIILLSSSFKKETYPRKKNKIQERIKRSITIMRDSHKILTRQSLESKSLHEIFFGKRVNLDKKIEHYLDWASQHHMRTPPSMESIDDLLYALDQSTDAFEEQYEVHSRILVFILVAAFIFCILTLLLIGFLIFKPMTVDTVRKKILLFQEKKRVSDLNLNLERRIEERTKELRQEKRVTEQQAKDLLDSNRELNQFAYVASHDLQEPLRMVTSYLQLLKRKYQGRLDKNADEYIEFAVNGAMRMKNLITNLLEYSRIGTSKTTFKKVDLNEIVRTVQDNLKLAITESQTKIESEPLPEVMGDRIQLERLFQNLIGNAIKYQEKSVAPVIELSVQGDRENWTVAIKDNGIGIPQSSFENIFLIFERLDTSQKFSGSGIGLSICKKIVERHSGKIWVKSKVGSGSIFYFTIPKVQAVKNVA